MQHRVMVARCCGAAWPFLRCGMAKRLFSFGFMGCADAGRCWPMLADAGVPSDPACLLACLLACLPACPAILPAQRSCLPSDPACPAILPACWPACWAAFFLAMILCGAYVVVIGSENGRLRCRIMDGRTKRPGW